MRLMWFDMRICGSIAAARAHRRGRQSAGAGAREKNEPAFTHFFNLQLLRAIFVFFSE